MKLRISSNTVRLRLSQNDVKTLMDNGSIAEKVGFPKPSHVFEYRLSILKSSDVSHVLYDGQKMMFEIPELEISNWANSNQEGIYKKIDTNDMQTLTLQIEKDYKCLHKENEVKDTFPNPKELSK